MSTNVVLLGLNGLSLHLLRLLFLFAPFILDITWLESCELLQASFR